MTYASIYLWSNGVLVMSWAQVAENTIFRHADGSVYFEGEANPGRGNFTIHGDYAICHALPPADVAHPVRR